MVVGQHPLFEEENKQFISKANNKKYKCLIHQTRNSALKALIQKGQIHMLKNTIPHPVGSAASRHSTLNLDA